ncbi:hypothetical protein ACTWJ8_40325 (plasmid) [Streptomyces sp. SDT5-1]|uniref:hypothetical protein n=1 Tax=Streptomyces sp. SDT5-1 TaxID=3406418 RepID=UPI003FCEED93
MRELLNADGLKDAPDSVRLAVVVLAARTPSESGVVDIWTSELGRWLGLSTSYVASMVVPGLRRSGVVSVKTAEGEVGQDAGLRCRVLPLWSARDRVGHPLRLAKREFATLLRLLEAVMGPGWKHRDGRVTPAGLLGEGPDREARTGRGAATDRLAALLLVLEARANGRVRLCGGAVDTRRGRAAATVARLLGCKASAGERVLQRLEARGVVYRRRVRTRSGLASRSYLVVPSVAAAHGRDTHGDDREVCSGASGRGFSDPAVTAEPGRGTACPEDAQVNEASEADQASGAEPASTATLHTDHSHLGSQVSSRTSSLGFSGAAGSGSSDLPGRAHEREDGPLRGEKPNESPVDEQAGPSTAGSSGGGVARRQVCPVDLDVRVALEPVSWLWRQLSRWQQGQVAAAAKAELGRLTGLLVQPDAASRRLAERLSRRLVEVGGEALVSSPYGWLIGRGLVQRPSCPDERCDDGIRLDTGAPCEGCSNVIHLKRARRRTAAARIDRDRPGLPAAERRQVLEEQLRETVAAEADEAVRQHERAAFVRAQRAEAREAAREQAEREQAQAAAEAAAREAQPCRTCGVQNAAGHCGRCADRESVQRLLRDAVDLAVAVRADLTNPAAARALAERCDADTRQLLAAKTRQQSGEGAAAASARLRAEVQFARRIRIERRQQALRRLARSDAAVAAGDAAYEAHRRSLPQAPKEDAQLAARAAEQREAERMLNQLLDQLAAVRAGAMERVVVA